MKNLDRLVSALYHAKSDNREKILKDLVLTVMYSSNEPVTVVRIIEFIKESFHLEPIKYEVEQCLSTLEEEKEISSVEGKFHMSSDVKIRVHSYVVKGKDNLDKRFGAFNKIVDEIFDGNLCKDDIQKLWDVYNEYLLECFMFFGRKAINIFMPFKDDDVPQSDLVLEQVKAKLNSEELFAIFKQLVVEYPNRLTEAELRHLNGLASRAEKFYSLGIQKEEYEKISNIQISNLIVIADTNILYTVLNLHVHQEKSAVSEIIRMAKNKIVDFRIVYFPKTYKELKSAKKPLENLISRENFSSNQIKAMLATQNLDSLTQDYYRNKLSNSEYPHPADNISYASDILKQQEITLYNQKFPKIEDSPEYFNKKIAEYLDYQRYVNNKYEENGSGIKLNKDDYKIEHDVYLREALKILRDKFNKEVLKFVCVTTDRSLIQFDQFMLRKEFEGQSVVNPHFMMPSVFIKKLRPFIPIVTNNYRRAFISSLTAPSFHRDSDDERDRTILTQKSVSYFKSLGINDEDVICGIIKKELFLAELSLHEKENTAEEYIKTEIASEIESLKSKTHNLQIFIRSSEKELYEQKKITERILDQEKQEVMQVQMEKANSFRQHLAEVNALEEKLKEKESLEDQIEKLNHEHDKFAKEKLLESKNSLLDEVNHSILTLENAEKPLTSVIETRNRNFIFKVSIVPILYFLGLLYLVYKLGWNTMEPITYFLSLGGGVITYLYFAILGKSLNPHRFFDLQREKIVKQVYQEFNFNVDYLKEQRRRRTALETEIESLSL